MPSEDHSHGSIGAPARKALACIASLAEGEPVPAHLRVNVHFHPDRLYSGAPMLQTILECGVYRSQFETATSNGGLTAYPGGDRWRWESRIFGGAYDDAPPSERPKYGSLNYRGRPIGASPRFGSAYFRLAGHTLSRTTFCFPDSVYEPRSFGIAARMNLIPLAEAAAGDPLDAYIEAHVHGPLLVERDIEAIVLDPCFQNTEVETLARKFPFPVEWHPGFRARVNDLRRHPDYRGPDIVEVAASIAKDGWLKADLIGHAARANAHDPQALKKVWHYLARFGVAASSPQNLSEPMGSGGI